MKIEFIKERLQWAIGLAEKITGKNLSLAVLNYVRLEAGGNVLKISATNLDTAIEIKIPCRTEKPGTAMVQGQVLVNFLANLPMEEKVRGELIQNTLALTSSRHSSVFKTYPGEDFPSFSPPEKAANFSLPAGELIQALRHVAFAASLSDIKPEIASVYWYSQNGFLYLVATDSFRLAEKKIKLPAPPPADFKLIVPIKNAAEAIRVFDGVAAEAMIIHFNPHQIAFSAGGIDLTSRLAEGVFPDYRQIIPAGAKTIAVVLKNDWQQALKLAQVFSDKMNQVTLKIAPSENLLEVNSQHPEIGESTSRLEATLQGDDLAINFNVRYLLDCLPAVAADSITLKLNGPNKPLVLAGVGGNSFLYLVMPLNR